MPHVILVGDSIFDNAAYTEGGPDVVSQVRGLLPPGWEAMLLAVDGAITDDVAGQLGRLPEQATHLVLSVGGNNALMHMGILEAPVASMTKAVEVLADVASDFERRYRLAVVACLERPVPWPCERLQRVFRRPVFPTRRVHDTHGIERRHHSSGHGARPSCRRPSLGVRHKGRLCRPDRTIVGGWGKDSPSDSGTRMWRRDDCAGYADRKKSERNSLRVAGPAMAPRSSAPAAGRRSARRDAWASAPPGTACRR